MSRATSGEQIYTRPTNNIYTVLAGAAFIVQAIGFAIIFFRARDIGGLW